MSPKVIVFTGAPDPSVLKWDEPNLITALEPSVARFCGEDKRSLPEFTATSQPTWILLSNQKHHSAGDNHEVYDKIYPQQYDFQGVSQSTSHTNTSKKSSQSFVTLDSCSSPQIENINSQFYDESYIRHENEVLSLPIHMLKSNSTVSSSPSNYEESSVDSSVEPSINLIQDVPISGCLTDLRDIPSAAYLDSIYPQTVTCNLIVGIISKTEARVIKTRRGQTVELIELLVGDETKSGFTVNFWMNSLSPQRRLGDISKVLYDIQVQDVVLIQNIALNNFQGKVYGQSLRRELTKIHFLEKLTNFRFKFGKHNGGVCHQDKSEIQNLQFAKINRVLDWLMRFVRIVSDVSRRREDAQELVIEELPPDTQ